MSDPIQGKVELRSSDVEVVASTMGTYPPALGGPPIPVETYEKIEINHIPLEADHWLGSELGMTMLSSSIPELRNITLQKHVYPPDLGIPDRYSTVARVYYNQSWRMFPEDYLQTAEDYTADYEAYKIITWEGMNPVLKPPFDLTLEELPSIYPGTPLPGIDNDDINPPCGGGGDGSPRPDFGVLYPRKV